MADISSNFLGIKSPNPFWLASAPPTDKKINVLRAFESGWGGVVWKTLGSQVKNVSSRYSAVNFHGGKMMGFNNIELISDRPLEINLKEIHFSYDIIFIFFYELFYYISDLFYFIYCILFS